MVVLYGMLTTGLVSLAIIAHVLIYSKLTQTKDMLQLFSTNNLTREIV